MCVLRVFTCEIFWHVLEAGCSDVWNWTLSKIRKMHDFIFVIHIHHFLNLGRWTFHERNRMKSLRTYANYPVSTTIYNNFTQRVIITYCFNSSLLKIGTCTALESWYLWLIVLHGLTPLSVTYMPTHKYWSSHYTPGGLKSQSRAGGKK